MCTFKLKHDALSDIALMHCGICATGLLESTDVIVTLFLSLAAMHGDKVSRWDAAHDRKFVMLTLVIVHCIIS